MALTPTQLSLRLLRDDGWTATVTERWNPFAKIRQDLFGCIDVLAFKEGEGILGVQATSFDNISHRKKKIRESEVAKGWVVSGAGLCVIGWRKVLSGRRTAWEPTIYQFSISDWENEH